MAWQRILDDGTLEAVAPSDTGGPVSALLFRAVSPTRPATSGWAVGDAWLDTGDPGTDGNVIRLWTGADFSPPEPAAPTLGTLLATDDFTGTDGAVWSASKWVLGRNPTVGSGGAATLLANAGRFQTSNAGSYNGGSSIARALDITDVADFDLLVSFMFDATEVFAAVHGRSTTELDGAEGYSVNLERTKWTVSENDNYVGTILGAEQTITFVTGTWYRLRFVLDGTAVKARIWAVGTTEPGTWGVNVTDATWAAAGPVGVAASGGNAAVNARMFFDDLELREPV